ncbi:MAG: hypothetical protein PHR52_07840 [Fermentimonas sp.]|nr:hypothetical protein [Fermentimonas sp.]
MTTLNKHIISRLIPITIFFLTIYTALPYVKPGIPFVASLDNTMLRWGVSILILIVFFLTRYSFYDKRNEDNMIIIWIYLLWNAVCIVRGMFVAEIYWDWKALTGNTMALMLPIIIIAATNKSIVQSTLSFYMKYMFPLFLLFIVLLRTDAYGFYLVPVTFLLLFFPVLTKRYKILLLAAAVIVLVADLGARSNVIKFGVPLLIILMYYLRKKIPSNTYEILRLSLFIAPLLFFALGVSGVFNVFNMKNYIKGEYTATGVDNRGDIVEMDVTSDTRTFIYEEVLESAIDNNYWLLGRTPARGNDSYTFGVYAYELTGRNERLSNEVGLANIFTWTGLVGVVIYMIIFFRATYLAVNKSRNLFSKLIGVYVAFRWLFAWIEDISDFSLNYFMIMTMLGLCFSYSFRNMNDTEVVVWVRGIFDIRYIRFQEYLMNKSKAQEKESKRLINLSTQEE